MISGTCVDRSACEAVNTDVLALMFRRSPSDGGCRESTYWFSEKLNALGEISTAGFPAAKSLCLLPVGDPQRSDDKPIVTVGCRQDSAPMLNDCPSEPDGNDDGVGIGSNGKVLLSGYAAVDPLRLIYENWESAKQPFATLCNLAGFFR